MESFVLQGRLLHGADLERLRSLIAAHPAWSRRRVSVELAQAWNWRTLTGQLKDMAARSVLLKLEERGWITLPPRRRKASRRLPILPEQPVEDGACASITATLSELTPLAVEPVAAGHPVFSRHLATHHYLGYRGPVGEHLAYKVCDQHGRDVACLLFGAAAWKAAPRDRFIGWDPATRARHLHLVVNNSRFLILPWVRVPHLASHVLALILKRVGADWQVKYGHPVHLVETFVQRDRFRGTCYRAANWIHVGQTQGRSRQDRDRTLCVPVKDIYLYPLTPHLRARLCHVDP